jgi:hypothetical protein
MSNDVSIFLQCYEHDFHVFSDEHNLNTKINYSNYNFVKKILIITNIIDRKTKEIQVQNLLRKKIIDSFYFVDDYKKEILDYFDLSEESFNGGYWYSIGPLSAVYFCDTKYMLYLTSDSLIENKKVPWIDDAINMFELNDKIISANPLWNIDHEGALLEQPDNQKIIDLGFFDTNIWYYNQVFSDQCFLIPTEYYKKKIYNEKNTKSEYKYPSYAGNSFEKRVHSHMINNNLYRITNKNINYYHPRYHY